MNEKKIATIAVGFVASVLASAMGVCMVAGNAIPPEAYTILGTLAGVLLGQQALSNGVKKINGNK